MQCDKSTVGKPTTNQSKTVFSFFIRYIPQVAADEAYIYLTVLGTLSSLLSIWGLLILQTSYKSQLAQFSVSHKFLYVQGVLLGTTVGNLVIGGLVSAHVITCNRLLPSASRAQSKSRGAQSKSCGQVYVIWIRKGHLVKSVTNSVQS